MTERPNEPCDSKSRLIDEAASAEHFVGFEECGPQLRFEDRSTILPKYFVSLAHVFDLVVNVSQSIHDVGTLVAVAQGPKIEAITTP